MLAPKVSDVEAAKSSGSTKDPVIFNEAKRTNESKVFRLFAVIAYICVVSGLGMMLAMYHLFFWDSRMPPVPVIQERVHH